jgi:hypothetical protein
MKVPVLVRNRNGTALPSPTTAQSVEGADAEIEVSIIDLI